MTSRTSVIDETYGCEKVISSAICNTKVQRQPCKYRSGHILTVLVQGCPRVDALVDFYSRGSRTMLSFW